MKQINIHNIRTDGGTQARTQLNDDAVNEYAELMKDGAQFPPMIVYHDGSDYWLADGFHRYFANKLNGTSLVTVDVRTGTNRDARLFSWGANKGRGLPLTNSDVRNIITNMLKDPECAKWTNKRIAEEVGRSVMTVLRVKKLLEPDESEQTIKVYEDKNGIERTVDTSKLSTRSAVDKPVAERPVGTKPDSSTVNEDKIAIANLKDQISELSEAITMLSEENAKLKDVIAIGQWDASEIEKMDIEDTVKELREQIRILEIESKSLRDGRDSYMNRNSELQRLVKSLQSRLKKYEA